uniref:RNase H type-1 domain-containing protein n=1 Tax=Fagus sylvatica TaxID=28930 RepID=A0A2N9FA28_FAGSY
MAGETSGPGPSEQEIRMVALERKFDELLSFVQLIAKRNPDDENQRKEDDKDTNNEEPEGTFQHQRHSTKAADATKARGERLPHVLVPQHDGATQVQGPGVRKIQWERRPHDPSANVLPKMAPYADNEPLLIQTFQDTLTGNAAEWYSQLKKISHWKELADTFLAQYGFNSQIAPDRFDLQRMEKKSNETFREYAQRWREKAARARPPLDEREMIKIFVDTLKNPYFDRMIGLQMQFFVDLIPVGERIEDALKTKKIVDMTALMALAEQAAKKAPTKKKEGDVQMIGRSNGRPRQALPTFTMQPIQPRPTPMPGSSSSSDSGPGPPDAGKASGKPSPMTIGWPRKRTKTVHATAHASDGDCLTSPPTPLPNHPEGGVNMVEIEEGGEERIAWRRLFYTLEKQRHITPLEAPPGPSTGDACEYHSGARGHSLECCEEFKKKSHRSDGERASGERREYHLEEIVQSYDDPKYGEKMALHLENELLMISVFPESLSKQAAAWFYQLRNLTGWEDLARAFLERYRFNPHSILEYLGFEGRWKSPTSSPTQEEKKKRKPSHCHQPKTQTAPPLPKEGEEPIKTPPPSNITTTAEEEYAGPMVEGLSIHTIAEEEDSTTTPPTRHCQQGEEAKMWTCVPLLQRVSSSNETEEKSRLGTRCTTEQKEALIALLREFHEIFAWSYQDMPGLDTDIVGTIRSKWPKKTSPRLLSSHTWGTFVYDVMPFGLKNAGATYQRAMVTLFHDMIHHEIEVYVDDMIAKSRTAQDHLTDLRKLFQRLKKYQLRLNPNKCAFGVTSGKLLGFIVSGRGIEIDPCKARFIAQLTATCEPLFKLLRKDVKIKWTEDCQRAFDKIKEYLLNPPILVPPTPGRPLILYLTVQEASMGCMLGQQDETGKKEQAIYYLSKKFTEPETRYLLVEKTCCALAWASKKLRQYMLYYTTWLVSRMDPIKYIFEKPALTGKIARWQVLLSEFDILFVARKAIKGQAIADYLADYPSEQWKLYFDGAANAVGSGIGAVLVSPKGQQTPIAVKLGFDCTNNMTEYEACIVGLQAALEFGAYELEVFGDSLLIVSQTNGEWQARDPKLIPYQRYISRLVPKFKYITFTYTPRAHNHFADALATLASLIKLVEGDDVRPLRIETRDIPAYYAEEANRLIQEMHAGLMGAHANGPFLARKIMRAGYYWLTMERDCIRHVQTCHKCQMYQNSKNAPPQYLHTMASPWPFSAWGMDVIGAITPKASNGHEFILVAIDYFYQVGGGMFLQECHSSRGHPLCQQFKIQHHNSAPYRPKDERSRRSCQQKREEDSEQDDWRHTKIGTSTCLMPLCAYRTSVRTSVGATPYSLVYGMEAVLPVEVEIPSLRILSQTQLEEAEWAQARYEQLNFIDEKRLAALCHGQLYQRRIERAYNKKARPRTFQPGDLVLKKRNMALSDSTRKVRTII